MVDAMTPELLILLHASKILHIYLRAVIPYSKHQTRADPASWTNLVLLQEGFEA